MANRRPVSALEIKREVEEYSSMNEDAFARRFYASRRAGEPRHRRSGRQAGRGFFEAELYALPPENYYLPAIEFTDAELAALRTALGLLDEEFTYAEPLRLALQQVSWGRSSRSPRARRCHRRAPLHRQGRSGALPAPGEDRDRDLAPQDDRVQLLRCTTRSRTQGRPVPPRLPRRPVLFDRPLARARRRPGLPPLADQGQGLVREQGRATSRPRRTSPTGATTRHGPSGRWAVSGGPPRSSSASGSPGWSSATSASTGLSARSRRPTASRAAAYMRRSTPRSASSSPGSWWRDNTRLIAPKEAATESARALKLLRERHRGEFGVADTVARPVLEADGRPAARMAAAELRVGDPARAVRPAGHPGRPPDRRRPGRRRCPSTRSCASSTSRRSCARTSKCSTS